MSYRDHLNPARLTPGVLDGAAELIFSTGGCAALAIALHDRTGWPLVMITDAHNVHGDHQAGGASALHWLVRHPDGHGIDVDGARNLDELVEHYADDADDGQAAWGISSRADAVDWYVEAQGEPIPIALAAEFIDAVLARAEASRLGPPPTSSSPEPPARTD